jgi:Presenilin enhancer-2 subunit of gamma secretase
LFLSVLFFAGFALLPWLWFVNIWFFFPAVRDGHDPVVSKCKSPLPCGYRRYHVGSMFLASELTHFLVHLPPDALRSAIGFGIASAIFLPWMLTFMIGQEAVFGEKLFNALDASKLNMQEWGLVF